MQERRKTEKFSSRSSVPLNHISFFRRSTNNSFTFTDGCRFATEINAQMWLKKIGLSKVSTGEGDIYRMQLYPVEMLVPLHIAAEAIEDMLHMLPEEKLIEILRSAEERFKNW